MAHKWMLAVYHYAIFMTCNVYVGLMHAIGNVSGPITVIHVFPLPDSMHSSLRPSTRPGSGMQLRFLECEVSWWQQPFSVARS